MTDQWKSSPTVKQCYANVLLAEGGGSTADRLDALCAAAYEAGRPMSEHPPVTEEMKSDKVPAAVRRKPLLHFLLMACGNERQWVVTALPFGPLAQPTPEETP